jgi:hypothetical protein
MVTELVVASTLGPEDCGGVSVATGLAAGGFSGAGGMLALAEALATCMGGVVAGLSATAVSGPVSALATGLAAAGFDTGAGATLATLATAGAGVAGFGATGRSEAFAVPGTAASRAIAAVSTCLLEWASGNITLAAGTPTTSATPAHASPPVRRELSFICPVLIDD